MLIQLTTENSLSTALADRVSKYINNHIELHGSKIKFLSSGKEIDITVSQEGKITTIKLTSLSTLIAEISIDKDLPVPFTGIANMIEFSTNDHPDQMGYILSGDFFSGSYSDTVNPESARQNILNRVYGYLKHKEYSLRKSEDLSFLEFVGTAEVRMSVKYELSDPEGFIYFHIILSKDECSLPISWASCSTNSTDLEMGIDLDRLNLGLKLLGLPRNAKE